MELRPSFSNNKRQKISLKSNKKYNESAIRSNNASSSLFDDYEEVYEELDSLCEDQFFHPLEESVK